MKLSSLAFVLLLVIAHAAVDPDRAVELPLSMFRDGDRPWVGYALFGHLLLIGVLYIRGLARSDRIAEAVISSAAVVLLAAIAVTPSLDGFHHLFSFLLLLLLFGYYGLVLYKAESGWLFAHLAAPVVLVFGIGFHSYGLWQKMFIVYIVGAAVVHHHLCLCTRVPGDKQPRRGSNGGYPLRKRKVYQLEHGRTWGQSSARGSSVV